MPKTKNMKLSHFSILVSITLFQTSCTKSFLEINDNSSLYRQNAIKDAATLAAYNNGILQEFAAVFQHGVGSGYAEIISDNLKPVDAGKTLLFHYNWQQEVDSRDGQAYFGADPKARSANPMWKNGYRIIRNCNYVLEEAGKYQRENSTLVNSIKGQALALRALLHFKLCQVFAQHYSFSANASHPGIPYITSSNVAENFPRITVGEVYKNMIEDLETAQSYLPTNLTDPRVFNQESAKAILSRIFLFKEDFAKAEQLAKSVIKNHPLMQIAEGYPARLFMFDAQKSNSETIFQLSPQGGPSLGATTFLGVYLKKYVNWYATSDIANILREDTVDIRSKWVQVQGDAYMVTKFPENAAPEVAPALSQPTASYYEPIIRSSELYLTIAECAAKSGNFNTAQEFLNSVRLRANPNIPNITPVGSALIDSIYKERRKELAFEGLRMFDLQRWKQGVHRIDALPGSPKDLPYPSAKSIAPIPPNDVKLAGISQNPAY